MEKIASKQLYAALISESTTRARDENELLLWMLLLLTHEISLHEPIMEDFPSQLVMPAITQRTAAEILSIVWPEQEAGHSPNDWYRRFQLGIGDPRSAETSQKVRLAEMATLLKRNLRVSHVKSRVLA